MLVHVTPPSLLQLTSPHWFIVGIPSPPSVLAAVAITGATDDVNTAEYDTDALSLDDLLVDTEADLRSSASSPALATDKDLVDNVPSAPPSVHDWWDDTWEAFPSSHGSAAYWSDVKDDVASAPLDVPEKGNANWEAPYTRSSCSSPFLAKDDAFTQPDPPDMWELPSVDNAGHHPSSTGELLSYLKEPSHPNSLAGDDAAAHLWDFYFSWGASTSAAATDPPP